MTARTARLFALIASLAVMANAAHAQAQNYPSRPLRYIVAFPPGASMDLSARAIAQKLGEGLGQPVIVDNRPGGNTIVAADVAAHAAPDGYTLFMALDSTLTLLPVAYAKVPFDPIRDFAPVTLFSRGAYTFFARTGAPYRTLGELVAWIKANPGKLNVGASVAQTQLLAHALKQVAGVEITSVPYKGTPPMLQALTAGELDVVIDAVPLYLPLMKAGKVMALATTGAVRTVQLPDTPTTREAGFPQIEAEPWVGVFAPAGTPEPIIRRLNTELHRVFNDPEFRKRMQDVGQNPIFPSTPEQLGNLVKTQLERSGPAVRAAGIKLE